MTNLKLCFPPKLFARNKTVAAPNGEFERFGGFALTVYTTRCEKESRVESSFSTAPKKKIAPLPKRTPDKLNR